MLEYTRLASAADELNATKSWKMTFAGSHYYNSDSLTRKLLTCQIDERHRGFRLVASSESGLKKYGATAKSKVMECFAFPSIIALRSLDR